MILLSRTGALTLLAILTSCLVLASATARAQDSTHGLMPAATGEGTPIITYGADRPEGEDTHPAIRMTPDKSELVRLEQTAASVIVGNPNHLGVLMETSRLLILVPRQPGATYLTVLDAGGNVIMQRHIIVSIAKQDYVRVRRSCNSAGGSDCQQTSVYYCPGMCHEVGLVENAGNEAVPPLPSSATISQDGDTGADEDDGNSDGTNDDEGAEDQSDDAPQEEGSIEPVGTDTGSGVAAAETAPVETTTPVTE